jgi:glycosyltransferase involved in cell wall biosynthesis
MTPHFSVIVPVYSRDPSRALKSVKDQTFRDWECIVVDDGSPNGPEMEAAVKAMLDNRFRYVRRTNGGGGAARNTGIDEARAHFVAFLDSDDEWLPKKLQIQAIQLQRGERVAYGACYVDRGVGKRWIKPSKFPNVKFDMAKYFFIKNQSVPTPTIALSTEIARAVRWDESLKRGQEMDFVLRLRAIGAQFDYMPEPIAIINDVDEDSRVSRAPGIENHLIFLGKHKMNWRARWGYRAIYLAYDLAKEKPLMDLFLGLFAGVSPLIIARQTLRAFMPRHQYRKLVNSFVAVAGK